MMPFFTLYLNEDGTDPQGWPFKKMKVGQALHIPSIDNRIRNCRQYAYIRGRELGMTFTIRKLPLGGVVIIRTA